MEDLEITTQQLQDLEKKREDVELRLSAEKSAEDLVRRKKEEEGKLTLLG